MKHQGCYPRKLLVNSSKTDGGAALFALLARCLVGVFLVPAVWAQVNVLTWHNDAARSGQNLQETLLSPSNVSSANFGLLSSFAPLVTDGAVDAQPLYVGSISVSGTVRNVLYVATENDSLYAFDADAGTQLWKQSLLSNGETAVPIADVGGCTQVAPILGISSTPAIDLSLNAPDGTIFLVTMTVKGSTYYQRLHALDLVTGVEESGWPILVQATYPSTGPQSSGGVVTFNPQQYKERAALLISNGMVYTSWASHCDGDPYNGWIIGYNESTRAQVVLNLTPNGDRGAIWQSGAGPAADAGGDLYFLMANGYFDGTLNASGFPADGDYGNAFMNLSTLSGLTVQDYFTSDNSPVETGGQNDTDLGSGGAMLLPTLNNAMGNPVALAVGAGKDGNAYVVDRNNMGGYNGSSNAVYQQFPLGGAVFSSPAWFNNTLYYSASDQPLAAYPYSGGFFGSATKSSPSFGNGATPSISALGSTNGIVWAVNSGSPAVLYAFNATNMSELYNSTQAGSRDTFGTGIHFTTPTIANGKVYVGTTTGVGVFGLLPSYCTYPGSATYGNASFDATSHSGGFGVTAGSGCAWSATTTSNFITITGGASGTGSGGVTYSIPANPGAARSGTIEVAGHLFTITQSGNTTTSGLAFYPLTPCRISDTRTGFGFEGAFGPPSLVGTATRSYPIPNSFCGVPPTQAYSFNVTVLPPAPLGYLTVWPTGSATPNVSTLNAPDGIVTANAAILTGGTDAGVSFYASANTGLLVDTNGYFAPPTAPQALAFYTMTPCRVVDTRTGFGFTGAFGPPSLVAATPRSFPMQQSSCGIPSTAQVYSVRMTVVPPGPVGYLTTWPEGQTQPNVSTLNAPDGGVVGNQAFVPAGSDAYGSIDTYASANTNLLVDINGYFAPPGSSGALYFYPITPCRIADTRTGFGFSGSFGPPSLVGGATRSFPVLQSSCGIPDAAQAYSLNLTAVVPSGGELGYLTAFPTGETLPNVSTVNAPNGGVVASSAIVPAGTSGAISVFASSNTNLLIDINGYFAP
jgi:hypothetical protein